MCQSFFATDCPPPHTTSGLGGVQDLGGLVRHAEALLKGPFFTSSALALPPLPHPLPLHISAQAIVLVLCPSVFLCVDGVLCSREFLWPFRYASLSLFPSHNFRFCLGGRALRAVWWMHAPRVRHILGTGCTLAIVEYCDEYVHLALSCVEPSDVVHLHGRTRVGIAFHSPVCTLPVWCRQRRASAAAPGSCCWLVASCYACACDLSVRQTY